MRVIHLLLIVTVLGIAIVLLGGCSKKGSSPPASFRKVQAQEQTGEPRSKSAAATSEGDPPPQAEGSGGPSSGTVKLEPVHPDGSAPSPLPGSRPGSPGPGASSLKGTDLLLSLRGAGTVYPSDYEIGSLQPLRAAGTEQGQIIHTIRTFFESLRTGSLDTSLLSPEWKDNLIRLLRYPENNDYLPSTVRIGRLHLEQDNAHAAVRMEKGEGSASGEIYLERVDGTWYISDIQADFSQLSVPFKRSEPFDPAEWKAMMKE